MLSTAVLLALSPTLYTQPVAHDADDPAIWVHPTQPAKSRIIGTDKEFATGGIYVFDLEGQIVQRITPIDRPNNVDVETGFALNGRTVDLAVTTERGKRRLRVFAIDGEGKLEDVTGSTALFTDRQGEGQAPMGIGLWKSDTGTIRAIVSPKEGPREGYLGVFRLVANGGKVDAVFERAFGAFSGRGEIEALVVDDALGLVHYADEGYGLRTYSLKDWTLQAVFGTGYRGDREGLAVWPSRDLLVSTDQIEGGSRLFFYQRSGGGKARAILETSSDETDGIELVDRPLGEKFPAGVLVMMNSKDRNFAVYDLRTVASVLDQGG